MRRRPVPVKQRLCKLLLSIPRRVAPTPSWIRRITKATSGSLFQQRYGAWPAHRQEGRLACHMPNHRLFDKVGRCRFISHFIRERSPPMKVVNSSIENCFSVIELLAEEGQSMHRAIGYRLTLKFSAIGFRFCKYRRSLTCVGRSSTGLPRKSGSWSGSPSWPTRILLPFHGSRRAWLGLLGRNSEALSTWFRQLR